MMVAAPTGTPGVHDDLLPGVFAPAQHRILGMAPQRDPGPETASYEKEIRTTVRANAELAYC